MRQQTRDWTDFPSTALEFDEQLTSEQACHDYLARQCWPDGFLCPAALTGTLGPCLGAGCSSPRAALVRSPCRSPWRRQTSDAAAFWSSCATCRHGTNRLAFVNGD